MKGMQRKAIARNAILLNITGLVSSLFFYIFLVLIARHWGASDFGRFIFALTFVSFFQFSLDLGLSQFLIRELSRFPDKVNHYFYNFAGMKLISAIGSFILMAVIIRLLNYPPDTRSLVYLLGAAEIFNSYSNLYRSMFRVFQDIKTEAIIWTFDRIFLLAFCLPVLVFAGGPIPVAFVLVLVAIIKMAVSYYYCKSRYVTQRVSVDVSTWSGYASQGFHFGLIMVLGLICFKVDTVMLSIMKGDTSVGYYNVAYRLYEGLSIFPLALNSVVFPALSYYASRDPLRFESITTATLKYMALISLPIICSITFFGERIIMDVYGEGYAPSVLSLKILIWAFIFHSFFKVPASVLLANGHDKYVTFCLIAGTVFNITMNLFLIPQYDFYGASIATVITEVIMLLLCIGFTYRFGYRLVLPDDYKRIGIVYIFMMVISLKVKELPLLLSLLICGLSFIILLELFRVLSIREIRDLIRDKGETIGK